MRRDVAQSRFFFVTALFCCAALLIPGCDRGESGEETSEASVASSGSEETNEASVASFGLEEPVGACDRREGDQVCVEFHGTTVTPNWIRSECDGYNGSFMASCPAEGALIRCVRFAGTAQEVHELAYSPIYSAEACTNSGGELGEL